MSLPKFTNLKTKRDIIQISTCSHIVQDDFLVYVTCLCNDGTTWFLSPGGFDRREIWEKLPDIPQPEEEKNAKK